MKKRKLTLDNVVKDMLQVIRMIEDLDKKLNLMGATQSALIDLKEFEGDTAKHSMMDSYSVARVLNRGHRRILL